MLRSRIHATVSALNNGEEEIKRLLFYEDVVLANGSKLHCQICTCIRCYIIPFCPVHGANVCSLRGLSSHFPLDQVILCQNFLRADSLLPFLPGVENSIKFLCSFEDGHLCDESTQSILKESLLLLSSQVQKTQQILDHLRSQVMLPTAIPQQTASWNTPRRSEQGYGPTQVIPARSVPSHLYLINPAQILAVPFFRLSPDVHTL